MLAWAPSTAWPNATAEVPPPAGTAAPAAEAPPLQAHRLPPGLRPPLDGRLDHALWQAAPPFTRFVEKWPVTGAQPVHPTEVRVLYDDEAIYIGLRCRDPQPELIRDPIVRRDGVNRTQDFAVVYLDAIGARQSAQFFRVSAAGSIGDGMHTAADDFEDFGPDFEWDASAQRLPDGWSAVMRIPFASLRFTSGASAGWRIMVARRVPRGQFFLHTSVLIPRESPSFIHTLQPLDGLSLPEGHRFLSLKPSLTWRRQRDDADPQASRSRFDASLDIKWRPLPELVVDAALNPDFSQVELDVPQLSGNTRFSLAIDEKRPFFYESSDLLRTPTEALYTRSVTAPRWGLRGTWRGARLAATALALHDQGGGLVLLPGAYGNGAVAQPPSDAVALRARADGGRLQWGAVLAGRQYTDGRGGNLVLGPDLAWQIDGDWRARVQWLQSSTTALADGAQGLQRGPADGAHRLFAKFSYQTRSREADVWIDDVDGGFRNDLGFSVQNGVRIGGLRVARGWQQLGPFNELWANFEAQAVTDRRDGRLISTDVHPNVWLTGPHNLEALFQWHGWNAVRTARDRPLLRERYLAGHVVFTPAAWLPLLNTEFKVGRILDVGAGRIRPGGQLMLSLATRPLDRLELEPRLFYTWAGEGSDGHFRESAHQLLARWHFSARSNLRLILQFRGLEREAEAARPGFAAIDGESSGATVGSLTWSWRRPDGSVLYVGAAREAERAEVFGVAPRSQRRANELFVKWQFDLGEAWQRLSAMRQGSAGPRGSQPGPEGPALALSARRWPAVAH